MRYSDISLTLEASPSGSRLRSCSSDSSASWNASVSDEAGCEVGRVDGKPPNGKPGEGTAEVSGCESRGRDRKKDASG